MARQSELFAKPKIRRRKLMHVCDAGAGEDKPICQFKCSRCDYVSDWMTFDTVTEAKRGLACPRCN